MKKPSSDEVGRWLRRRYLSVHFPIQLVEPDVGRGARALDWQALFAELFVRGVPSRSPS